VRIFAIILVLLVALAAALFALGVFDPADPQGDNPTAGPGTQDPGDGSNGASLTGTTDVPDEAPAIEAYVLDDPLTVLLLARHAERMPAFMAQQWNAGRKIKVLAWAPAPPADVEGADPEALGRYAEVLSEPPSASLLHDRKIDVLAIHGLDPATLDTAFWDAVLDRVRTGRLGLLLMPGRREGGALLDHETIKLLSPVTKSTALEGPILPGVFARRVAFEPTEVGLTHAATRLVAWPRWSRSMWASKATGDHMWATTQTWPIAEVNDEAAALLEVSPPRGDRIPVLIAGQAEEGRVLFFGAYELMDRKGYGVAPVVEDYGTVLRNWLVWLAGRV
jgi:hypothetical protein